MYDHAGIASFPENTVFFRRETRNRLAGEEASQQLGLRGCDVAIIMAESESVLVLFLMESKQMIRSKVFFAVGMVCLHSIVLDCSSTQNSSGHSGFCGSSDQC